MFIGHYGLGLAGRAALRQPPPGPSLGTWFMAVQWLDLVWPLGLLTGLERVRVAGGDNPFLALEFVHYPWSHSLLMAAVWAVLFAAVYRWRTGNGRAALWLGGGVFSHWVLDFIVHVPDLPLYPGSDVKLGLGLWRSVPGTLLVEFALFLACAAFYLRATRPRDAVGRWACWALLAFLALGYVSTLFGPPPPSVVALGLSALVLLWALVAWAYWVERHRERAS
jgi:membrane-bound metal-dependent hydrolase YbcI (DUF457 family)